MRSRSLLVCIALLGLAQLTMPATKAAARVAPGERCRVEGVVRSGSASSVRCTLGARGTLRWRAVTTASPTPSASPPSTPATAAVAPLLLDVNASWDRGVIVHWLSGKPSQGVVSLQWSTSPTFDSYDMLRATGNRATISADWFAGRTTYYVRAFEMPSSWPGGSHSNENITGHSNLLSFTLVNRPSSIPLSWIQRGADIDGRANNDVFGSSVDISDDGTVVIVGAPNAASSGRVNVYAWNGSSWVERGAGFSSSSGDRLGEAVAVSGDGLTIAMAAPRSGPVDEGEVNTYLWNGTTWNQRGTTVMGSGRNDEFGQALALSYDGATLVASSSEGGSRAGYVRVLVLSGGAWTLRGAEFTGTGSERIGRSVAVSDDGSYVAFGAPYGRPGFVGVYKWTAGTPGTWTSIGPLFGGDTQEFGRSIDLSEDGRTLVIGSPTAPGGGTERGFTRVYRWDGTSWSQLGADINGAASYDQSGWSVSLSDDGSSVAIGSRLSNLGGIDSGSTRIYTWDASTVTWVLSNTFAGEAEGDQSGHAVSLSSDGRIVAIGGNYNAAGGSQRGHVRVYSYE